MKKTAKFKDFGEFDFESHEIEEKAEECEELNKKLEKQGIQP